MTTILQEVIWDELAPGFRVVLLESYTGDEQIIQSNVDSSYKDLPTDFRKFLIEELKKIIEKDLQTW